MPAPTKPTKTMELIKDKVSKRSLAVNNKMQSTSRMSFQLAAGRQKIAQLPPKKSAHFLFHPQTLEKPRKSAFPTPSPAPKRPLSGGTTFFPPRPYPATLFENQIRPGHHRAPDHPCPGCSLAPLNQKSQITNRKFRPCHDTMSRPPQESYKCNVLQPFSLQNGRFCT